MKIAEYTKDHKLEEECERERSAELAAKLATAHHLHGCKAASRQLAPATLAVAGRKCRRGRHSSRSLSTVVVVVDGLSVVLLDERVARTT